MNETRQNKMKKMMSTNKTIIVEAEDNTGKKAEKNTTFEVDKKENDKVAI